MTAKVRTEADMLELLRRRYSEKHGNGEAWAFMPHVRDAAGFNASRTIDAIAMSLWPSRGLELHGHEIKCSRSDWLRELRNPAKAETFTQLVDRWWLVVADTTIVADGELPPTWGLMVATGRGLTVKVQAPELPATDAPWMPKGFLAALLRSACRVGSTPKADVAAALAQGRADGEQHALDTIEGLRRRVAQAEAREQAFSRTSGIKLWDADFAKIGAAVRTVLDGDEEIRRYQMRLANLRTTAAGVVADIDSRIAAQEVVGDGA